MYVIKNAWKSISRSKGRNILIGIIVFVISVSACLGLSIREAANKAKDDALSNLTITAQISVDRTSMMSDMKNSMTQENGSGSFDKSQFSKNMQSIENLSIEELLTYASADTVSDFYYTLTVSMNGTDDFEAVDTSVSNEDTSSSNMPDNMDFSGAKNGDVNVGGKRGFTLGSMGTQGDFTIIGYSSDYAMTDFINGTCIITEGIMFEEGTEDFNCVISDELASYNDLTVGDTITLTNPNDEEEAYELTIVGIYNNSQSTVSSGSMMGGFSTSTDPANQIYLSYAALKSITTASAENATTATDENTGRETTTALPEQLSSTYIFASVDDYEQFAKDVYDMGLSENYTVSSSDVSAYEQSLLPLENLSQMALYFLIVVLAIGAVVLVVLNIFSVRERKYEVGVLTAIGMKKSKVSLQFMMETLIVTVAAVVFGGIIGAASSVPVTNSLLASQVAAESTQAEEQAYSFGRDMGNTPDGNSAPSGRGSMEQKPDSSTLKGQAVNYVSEVSSATDLTVLLKLLGIGILLTIIASAASIIFIMRYDPLKILSNRD